MVLIPVVLILISLPGMITWISKKAAFFGGNTLLLVALIPVLCGIFLFLGMVIITKKEEKIVLTDHELLKKNSPEFSEGKELRDISALIDAINRSLERIQNSTKDICALSKKITLINQQFSHRGPEYVSRIGDQNSAVKKLPLPPVPPVCTDMEMPTTTESLKIAVEKIHQTVEYKIFKTPVPEKKTLYMLFEQLKMEYKIGF